MVYDLLHIDITIRIWFQIFNLGIYLYTDAICGYPRKTNFRNCTEVVFQKQFIPLGHPLVGIALCCSCVNRSTNQT